MLLTQNNKISKMLCDSKGDLSFATKQIFIENNSLAIINTLRAGVRYIRTLISA